MRLIKLKVKNIASLKGEHLIDFAEIQRHSSLFAITGETGAGKSSILNSIGLALYGKVYKSNVTQNDLVTLGEKEGQIELIFQVKGKNYLAFWKARVRKQNGEPYSTPQTPQRELYTLEGDDFSSAKVILNSRAEELLNLDFDQYCKCIILNQGEFARFLSSSFTERKEILEKLYPGEMLESLSRELKIELDQLQKQKNDLDIELAALQGDGPQGIDLAAEKARLEGDYKIYEECLHQLESLHQHYRSLQSYHGKNLETKTRIEALKQTLAQETVVFNQLLIKVRESQERVTEAQEEQMKKLPILQELLKQEEQLRGLKEQTLHLTQNLRTKQLEHEKILQRKNSLAEQKNLWQKRSRKLTNSFLYPLKELREHQDRYDQLFDLAQRKGLLETELKGKEERLLQLENQGKEEAKELKDLGSKKLPVDEMRERLSQLEKERKLLQTRSDEKSKAELQGQELERQLEQTSQRLQELQQLTLVQTKELSQVREALVPVETAIKLQDLLIAVEVCLTHPSLEEKLSCPVCQSDLNQEKIQKLRQNVQKTDFAKIKLQETEFTRKLMRLEGELEQIKAQQKQLNADVSEKTHQLQGLNEARKLQVPDASIMEKEISQLQKIIWEQEKILQDEQRLEVVLRRTREQYLQLKNDIASKQTLLRTVDAELTQLLSSMTFLKDSSAETFSTLRLEVRKLQQWLEHETEGDKLAQEEIHTAEQERQATAQIKDFSDSLREISERVLKLSSRLELELKGRKASEVIEELQQKARSTSEELLLRERDLKGQELKLKETQSRQYTLDELTKDIDLQFTSESHRLRELSADLGAQTPELILLKDKLSKLSLKLESPSELFLPLRDLIDVQKLHFKEKTSELKMAFAEVRARLEDWEKRQDRITLLQLKAKDLTETLDRRARLYEVLGKDELRTFVLSLVEENLISQTNEELQKLCQGRYEIVHQSRRMKLTPEFYILDKFREGGLRKVSTLSGGETFMVSLAMALGLAEMTRGSAEIDSLFIDEGFGTLDQDSLEDVLDMLKQIQTRGLMVGLISHVKALTSALPVNLQVTKKQDGTSSVSIVFN